MYYAKVITPKNDAMQKQGTWFATKRAYTNISSTSHFILHKLPNSPLKIYSPDRECISKSDSRVMSLEAFYWFINKMLQNSS